MNAAAPADHEGIDESEEHWKPEETIQQALGEVDIDEPMDLEAYPQLATPNQRE